MRKLDIKPGHKFNKLTVVKELPVKNKKRYFLLVCECGNFTNAYLNNLTRDLNKSCGCIYGKKRVTHGMTGTPTYRSWHSIKVNCYQTGSASYQHYGWKGIKMSESWLKFENFFADMGLRPDNHRLARKDMTGDFNKDNCHWVKIKTKNSSDNKTKNGKKLTLRELIREKK